MTDYKTPECHQEKSHRTHCYFALWMFTLFILVAILIILLTFRYLGCKQQTITSDGELHDTILVQCPDHHYDSILVETNNNLINLGVLLQKNEAKLDIIIEKLQFAVNISSGSSPDLDGIRKQLDSIYNVLEKMRDDSIAVTVRNIKKP